MRTPALSKLIKHSGHVNLSQALVQIDRAIGGVTCMAWMHGVLAVNAMRTKGARGIIIDLPLLSGGSGMYMTALLNHAAHRLDQ